MTAKFRESRFSMAARSILWAVLIFAPLARGAVQDWAVTLLEMGVLLSVTAWLLARTLAWDWNWHRTTLDGPLLALAILVLSSAAASGRHPTSLWAAGLFFTHIAVFYLVIHLIRSRSTLKKTLRAIIWTAVLVASIGFLKSSGSPLFSYWTYEHGNQLFRMSATFGNADHLAGYMEMVILLALGIYIFHADRAGRRLQVLLIAALAAVLLFSLSRGGWIGGFCGILFLGIAHRRISSEADRRITPTILVLVAACVVVLLISTPVAKRIRTFEQKDKIPNLQSRILGWRGTLEMIEDYPLLGVGPGNYADTYQRYQPPGLASRRFFAHNDYLQFAAEVGLFFVPILAWAIIRFFRQGFRKLRSPSRLVVGTTLGAMSGVTAILVHSAGDFNLHIPANALLFTVLVALVVSPEPPEWVRGL